MTNLFPPSPLGTKMIGADQLDSAAADGLCCEQFLDLFLYPLVVHHHNRMLPVSMVISVSGVVPMDVSSFVNCEAYS